MNYKKLVTQKSFWISVLFTISIIFLVSFMGLIVLTALFNGTHVNTYAANGTFQLYNPLRRLIDGQIIGIDFPFFHGIGVPFLHLPVFTALGSGVFAAEVAKWIVSPFIFLGSSFLFFLAFFKKIKLSIIALAMFTLISLNWIDIIWPSNSLMGVRGAIPVLIAAALVWKTSKKIAIKRFTIPLNEFIALLLLGIAPVFGTEHGLAAIAAYALVNFILIIRSDKNHIIRNISLLALKGVFIILVAFVTYSLITLGHPMSAITYALVDVPQDQGWYFGSGPGFYLTIHSLLPALFNIYTVPLWIIITLGTAMILVVRKIGMRPMASLALWFMITYGVILFFVTIWGYYYPVSQLIPIERMTGLIAVIFSLSLAFQYKKKSHSSTQSANTVLTSLLVVYIVAIGASLAIAAISHINTIKEYDTKQILRLSNQARNKDDYFALSEGWKSAVDSFKPYIDPSKVIWSTYTSAYDSLFGNQLNPSTGGEDYIIHALGDARREAYQKDFIETKPHYVITLKPSYFPLEEWLWQNHWGIYKQLFTNYSLVTQNSSHYLWKIKDTPQSLEKNTQQATVTNNTVRLPGNDSNSVIVYQVNLSYDAHASIGLVSKLPRYLITIQADYRAQNYSLYLPSHKKEWSFPVVVMPGEKSLVLKASTDGIIPANLTIKKVSYTEVEIPKSNMGPIENNICTLLKIQTAATKYPIVCDPVTDRFITKDR